MVDDHLNNDLQGKVAIVTGAASGIGRATTQLLAQYGMSVVAEDINPDVAQQFSDLEAVAPLVGDVGEEQTARDAVALADQRFGRLDVLINNAGTIINKSVVDTTLEDWNRILNTNVTGAFDGGMSVAVPN